MIVRSSDLRMLASRRLLFAGLLLTIFGWSVPACTAVHPHSTALEPGLRPPAAASDVLHYSTRSKSDDTSIDSAGPDDTPGVVDTTMCAETFALAAARLHVSTSPHVPFGYERSRPSRAPPA